MIDAFQCNYVLGVALAGPLVSLGGALEGSLIILRIFEVEIVSK